MDFASLCNVTFAVIILFETKDQTKWSRKNSFIQHIFNRREDIIDEKHFGIEILKPEKLAIEKKL